MIRTAPSSFSALQLSSFHSELLVFHHFLSAHLCQLLPPLSLSFRARQKVFLFLEVFCYIEFSERAATLAVANLLTIYPKVESRVDAIEVNQRSSFVPGIRNRELRAVASDGVVFPWSLRRTLGKGVAYVQVYRGSVAVYLPVGRDGNFFPGRIAEAGFEKILRPFSWVLRPVKFPVAVEEFEPWRAFAVALDRGFRIRVCYHGCVGFFGVQVKCFQVVPFFGARGIQGKEYRNTTACKKECLYVFHGSALFG